LEAACILTGVGSLTDAALRLAGRSQPTLYQGRFEIVSLVGTLSKNGLHLHMAIADDQGQVIGGHVMTGCLIYTTAELVIGVLDEVSFGREPDVATGFYELVIKPLSID
jgi:uncharacterized protein